MVNMPVSAATAAPQRQWGIRATIAALIVVAPLFIRTGLVPTVAGYVLVLVPGWV